VPKLDDFWDHGDRRPSQIPPPTVSKPGLGWLLPLVVFCWLCGMLAMVYAVLT